MAKAVHLVMNMDRMIGGNFEKGLARMKLPFVDGVIEIRQVFETSDFPPEILPPEEAAREETLRDELQRKTAKP
jgi:hypothetical protein